ncbi:Eco57I restriction-modification methylase domain-containing protein [Mucisphaera sp.]|uniref:Eco57I restriction-modification methylase domain-containing protein n=1 Tax=Mucisphaera sp. TaxID=2913024 RepID=UPI003D103FC5
MAKKVDPAIRAHLEWLGFVQPTGLVVSAPAMVRAGAILERNDIEGQRLLREAVEQRVFDVSTDPEPWLPDFESFAKHVLGWSFSAKGYAGTSESPIPEELEVALPEYHETLRPDFAVRELEPQEGAAPWQLFVQTLEPGEDLDRAKRGKGGLEVSAHGRMERLLRRTGVSAGLLFNGKVLRLVSAPRGESSGWLDFRVADMVQTSGRSICTALRLLLNQRRLLALPKNQRLAALLDDSRKFQNEVSEKLAEQVLQALYEFIRGFQAAHDASNGELLREVLDDDPDKVYHALTTVLLRLVFLLYAEEREMLPDDTIFLRSYSIGGLYERLRDDAALYPDTMDQRYGAWAQLIALTRMLHDGAKWDGAAIPARRGHLFDPDRFPFLEGRSGPREDGERLEIPLVPDGTVYRALEKLLVLDGERISYRALDVEQIGSVYETMMGFRLETAQGRSIAVKAQKKHGAPTTVNLEALLEVAPKDRSKWIKNQADRKLTPKVTKVVKEAVTLDELHLALDSVLDKAATPDLVPPGAMVLQPSDARRRSGSHYTPRSLTEPIVRKTFEPILKRLADEASENGITPEQILELKVCDPAMGSGAFLVEACRQLADELVEAWRRHDSMPTIPPDEDELLYARRVIAQRCLYGVDKNPMAADLAKLSIWLTTLAKDHAFTFLDHAFRVGDSLVGLSKKQIASFTWEPGGGKQKQIWAQLIEPRIEAALAARREILDAGDFKSPEAKKQKLAVADERLDLVRFFGDLLISAFFAGNKAGQRKETRKEHLEALMAYLGDSSTLGMRLLAHERGSRPQKPVDALRADPNRMEPFHWHIEFPEVMERPDPGFDAFVGNPPWGADFTRIEKDWLSSAFNYLRDFESALAFIEQTHRLVSRDGSVGLLLPDSFLLNDSSIPIRRMLAEGAYVYAIVNLSSYQIFVGATVRQSMLFFSNSIAPTNACFVFDTTPGLQGAAVSRFDVSLLREQDSWSSFDDSETREQSSSVALGTFFDVKQGYIPYRRTSLEKRLGAQEADAIVSSRAWHSRTKESDEYVRELQGKDVGRGEVSWSGQWVKYGPWVGTFVDLEWFTGPRLLVREIVGKPPGLIIASKCSDKFVHNPSILVVRPKPGYEIYLDLVEMYLNSSSATTELLRSSTKANKEVFPKILVKDLRNIGCIDLNLIDREIAETATKMKPAAYVNGAISSDADEFIARCLQGAGAKA